MKEQEKSDTEKKIEFEKFIEICQEFELYFLLDEAGSFIRRMNYMLKNKQIPPENLTGLNQDIIAVNKMQAKAAEQTKRFGVDFKLLEEYNETIKQNIKTPSPEYWVWLKHWNNWKNEFTDELWGKFMAAHEKQESIDEYLPKIKWNDKPTAES